MGCVVVSAHDADRGVFKVLDSDMDCETDGGLARVGGDFRITSIYRKRVLVPDFVTRVIDFKA